MQLNYIIIIFFLNNNLNEMRIYFYSLHKALLLPSLFEKGLVERLFVSI
jgi:hypothetical protein